MATIVPAVGTGLFVEVNGAVLKSATYERVLPVAALPYPTSDMSPNADGIYETPNLPALAASSYKISGPYDTNAPFHSAPYNLRKGVIVSVRLGMSVALIAPAADFMVESTTDGNQITELGRWEATLKPSSDDGVNYYGEGS